MLRRLILVVAVGLAIGLAILSVTSRFLTDFMWFGSLGLSQVFTTRLLWEWGIWALAFALIAIFFFINLRVTRTALSQLLWKYPNIGQKITAKHFGLVFLGASILLGLLYASGVSMYYWEIAQFFNGTSFGTTDPLFNRDIAFYTFQVPFYRILANTLMGLVVFAGLLVGGIYLASGSLLERGTTHLGVLGLIFVLIRAITYPLDMAEILYSPTGALYGAGYTDVFVRLWVQRISMGMAFLVAATIVMFILKKNWKPLKYAAALWLAVSIIGFGIVPSLVQNWIVSPNEFERERVFLDYHIDMTRQAYNIDNFVERDFSTSEERQISDIEENMRTIENARLWDPRPLLQTYRQLQEMRLYYTFVDADISRYTIDGEYRQTLLAARELDANQIQNRSWINEHLQYTHGYGVVMSPVNEVSRQGLPEFWISDIPPRSTVNVEVTQPRIYFGEKTDQYVIVNTRADEFDYPMGDRNSFYRYTGDDGVTLSSFLHRIAFALRFGNSRIILSGDLSTESRVLFDRNIVTRVNKIAPFLRFDRDPYIVLDEGRLYWIIDAYTISNRYPYSVPSPGWGNYVRNSVKVVIDAYNGSVDFYQVEPDPILETYAKILPGLFQPLSTMPAGIRAHIRYPEDFFALQARVFATYHMTDTRVFYNREDVWHFGREVYAGREQDVLPYYVVMDLPEEQGEEMVLMLPFTPARRNNLVAWLAARNDGEHYGEVIVYNFAKDTLTLGPAQIEARIDQDSEISQLLTLWGQSGSSVIRGNLLVLPIGESVLYIEPLFLQSEQSGMPQLQRVVVADQNELVIGNTLEDALELLLQARLRQIPGAAPAEPGVVSGEDKVIVGPSSEAYEIYQRASDSLREGDFAAFGEAWVELEEVLRDLIGE